jgi:chlorobactene glucosyltransferase
MVELLVVAVAAATLAAIVFQGIPIVFAALIPRLDPRPKDDPSGPHPLVSVIIAARNEALDLGPALDDLLAQTYAPMEILVVDGASTDGTRDVARARGPRVRVIEEPPLPPGWVGKSWACDVGYRASRGELLLFTDADMRYHPDTVGATVAWALKENADLATLAPVVVAEGFWEKVVLPFFVQIVVTIFRAPRVNHDTSHAAMANGQFTLVRRDAYAAVGGHAAVRGYVVEDVAIARAFRRAGKRLRVAWAPDLLSTRMYRDRHELYEGLRKTAHGVEFQPGMQVLYITGTIGFYLLPLFVLPFGLWIGSWPLIALGAFVEVAFFAKHVVFNKAIRMDPWFGLLFPLAAAFYVLILATSLVAGLRGKQVVWKGRSYAMNVEAPGGGG